MNEPWLALFAAINPAAVVVAFSAALERSRSVSPSPGLSRTPTLAAIGGGVACLLYLLFVLAADDLLKGLDIAPETFRIAAGVVMAVSGVAAILRLGLAQDGAAPGLGAALFPLALPLLASAAGLIAAVSYAVDEGEGRTLVAALVIVGVSAVLTVFYRPGWRPAADAFARLTGALLVVLAAGLIVGGVRDI